VSPGRAALLAAAVCAVATGCGEHRAAPTTTTAPVAHAHGAEQVRGTAVESSVTAQDFALRDAAGRVVRLSAERGHAVLLTFLYTRCPDVCPLLASNLNAVLRSLSPQQRSGVRVIAISVDPANDSPGAVRAFAKAHALLPQFHYLVGPKSDLKPVWQGYNLVVEPRNVEETEHSAYVLLIDRNGKPRLTYPSSVGAATMLSDLRRLKLT